MPYTSICENRLSKSSFKKLRTVLLLLCIGQNKLQGQPNSRGGKETPPPDGKAAKFTLQRGIHTRMGGIGGHILQPATMWKGYRNKHSKK